MEGNELEMASRNSDSLSPGEGVSDRGIGAFNYNEEDDDMFYVPERRPSLELGDVSTPSVWWLNGDQCPLAELQYSSMVSEGPINLSHSMDDKDECFARVRLESNGSFSSCYSFDSDGEKTTRKHVSKGDGGSGHLKKPELVQHEEVHPALSVEFTFKAIIQILQRLSLELITQLKTTLWKNYPQSFPTHPKRMDLVDLVDRLLERYNCQGALHLVQALLEEMGQSHLVNHLQDLCIQNEVCYDLRMSLKSKYSQVYEGSATQGEHRSFDSVFTDLHMTAGRGHGPNIQHEYRNIEKLNSHNKTEELISCGDIFSSCMIKQYVKCIWTTGMAGTGKSMAVQKFILDWADGLSHKHISLLFPLPLRELNAFHGSQISMQKLLNDLFPDTKKLKDNFHVEGNVLFILDGLDEYNHNLKFRTTGVWHDLTEPTSFDVLLTNLLRGNLLYKSLLWVTSRTLSEHTMPSETVHRVTEVLGFTDAQRDAYFKKRFPALQACHVIDCLNSCKTLQIMCHLPLFCSVLSQVFERTFREQVGAFCELPKSITPLYTQLLLQLLSKRILRAPARTSGQEMEFLMNTGKMAFAMLEKDQLLISEDQWQNSSVSIAEAVINSGVCTQFEVREYVMYSETVHSFIHPTVQEYMAALYVFLLFLNQKKNALKKGKFSWARMARSEPLDLYVNALEKSLHCENGRFNVFLRFLFGMTLKSNMELLRPFIASSENWGSVVQDTASLIRKKILENHHANSMDVLQHCLDELAVEISEAASQVMTA